MNTVTHKIQLNHFDCDQHTVQKNHFSSTQDDNQERYVIIKNFDYKSDGHLNDSQQIDGANSGTGFPSTNRILRPVGSSVSTIVSMKCASIVISNSVSLKCVSTDVSTERVSKDVSTEFVYTNVSTESVYMDALRISLRIFLLELSSMGVSTEYISTAFPQRHLYRCVYTTIYLNEFLRHLHGDIYTVVSLIISLPTSIRHVFI